MDDEKFGGSKTDRRRTRTSVVNIDDFHSLKRRSEDHENRLVQLETSNVQQVQEGFNLRRELSSIVEMNTKEIMGVHKWMSDHDTEKLKREYIIAWLLAVNTAALVFSGIALLVK